MELNEDVYFELPDGSVRKLQWAIYGLQQAGGQWYDGFLKSLLNFGLDRCRRDACCCMNSDGTLFVLTHFDDAIILGEKNKDDIIQLEEASKKEYKISDLGSIKYCLNQKRK